MTSDHRGAKRITLNQSGMIYGAKGEPIVSCKTQNVSATGALLELEHETEVPRTFILAFSRDGQVRRKCRVVWSVANIIGVKFDG